MPNYLYYQMEGGQEEWHPAPASQLANVRTKKPMFVTALLVDKLADADMDKAEVAGLKYSGDFYLDWDDASAPDTTAPHAVRCIQKMIGMGVNPLALKLYATGGKGFHCVVPAEIFMEKIPKPGTVALPYIFRELALELAVDTLDLRVYSGRRGRMWREPNVERPNGKYKVPISWEELQNIDKEGYDSLCSAPRYEPARDAPQYALDFAVLFERCRQKVTGKLAARKKQKPTGYLATSELPSFEALCQGRGVKAGVGFHPLAMQIAILANARGWTEAQLIENCQGLIDNHVSDGDRYNTPKKRELELLRMLSYTEDNPCYDVAVGPLKAVMSHQAPDLDGLPIAKEDIEDSISKGESLEEEELDEFSDVAGVSLTRFGVYVNTEFGQKRVCAVSFGDVTSLKSLESGSLICLDAQVLVNGKPFGRQALELDTFYSLQSFNRFCARLGHAFQGTDSHVRGMYMRAVEMAKKNGKDVYVTSREGLDIVNIPNHENPALHEPFMIWADSKGVILEPRARDTGIEIQFQGYPDQRGQFRTDLGNAPKLVEWLKEGDNKALLAETIQHMLSCQKIETVGKVLGWTTSCFYRMLFHKAYGQFPILHINGAAGSGKTSMFKEFLRMFYYQQEPKTLSPSSTAFAITYSAAGSTTPPLVIDEYKPHEMPPQMHDKLKLVCRDSYNGREVQRGGGTRENDDYRALHSSALFAPVCIIAEAVEEESALLERVVLATFAKPGSYQNSKNFDHFSQWKANGQVLAILGQYLAAQTLVRYSIKDLTIDFDALYKEARAKYLYSASDLTNGTPPALLIEKQQAKERTVFNFTVSLFGITRLQNLLEGIYGQEFEPLFGEQFRQMKAEVYNRMSDLYVNTQAEWLKVFNHFAEMSFAEDGVPYKLRKGIEYAVIEHNGKECVELYIRAAYARYRIYCRALAMRPLYQGEAPFVHGLKDCPALSSSGESIELNVPGGSHIFGVDELQRLGFRGFK